MEAYAEDPTKLKNHTEQTKKGGKFRWYGVGMGKRRARKHLPCKQCKLQTSWLLVTRRDQETCKPICCTVDDSIWLKSDSRSWRVG